MSTSSFADRLAYVRWLRSMGQVDPESDKDFAIAVGVKTGWLHKWKESTDAPTRRPEIKQPMSGLRDMKVTEDWLIDGHGDAPQPEMWTLWWKARRVYAGKPVTKRRPSEATG